MNYPRKFNLFATLAVAATLSLGGCKSNNQQTAQNPQPAPAASQPATPDQPMGQAPAPAQQAAAPTPPPPPQPVIITLPAGTSISVRTDSELGSKISQAGQSFSATVSENVRSNGQIIIPHGSRAEGVVVDAKAKGKIKGEGYLSIRLTHVRTKWGSYAISTAAIDNAEKGKGKRTAVASAGGAGLGAIIGGVAGGGKGAAIGALAGGGAGFAASTFTGNKQIVIPAESVIAFTLSAPVEVTEQPSQDDEPGLQQRPQ